MRGMKVGTYWGRRHWSRDKVEQLLPCGKGRAVAHDARNIDRSTRAHSDVDERPARLTWVLDWTYG